MSLYWLLGILAGVASVLGAESAFGQFYDPAGDFPVLGGIPGGVERELAFSADMDARARQFCHDWYQERQAFRIRHNYWGPMAAPVTAADLHRSTRELQQTYDRNNAAWHQQQLRLYGGPGQVGTVGQFSEQGIRGDAPHYNPATGEVIGLPFGPQAYHRDYHDRFHPTPRGTDDGYGETFFPSFGG